MRPTCNTCSGNGGWYTAQNGDIYLSDPDGTMNNWQRCESCQGTGLHQEMRVDLAELVMQFAIDMAHLQESGRDDLLLPRVERLAKESFRTGKEFAAKLIESKLDWHTDSLASFIRNCDDVGRM